jgi:hypothetical protein
MWPHENVKVRNNAGGISCDLEAVRVCREDHRAGRLVS